MTRAVPTRELPQAHAWMPTSPCGSDCLDVDPPRVGRLRAGLRLAGGVGVLCGALVASPLLLVVRGRRREQLFTGFMRLVLRAFGIRLVVRGESLDDAAVRGGLVVTNHVSWLDIVAVLAIRPMPALAKSEIAAWPLIGGLARRSGTVFIDRQRLRSLPATVRQMSDAMRGGSLVNVCGEGTTWCGRSTGRFVPAPFQAAIDGGVPVWPVALAYRTSDGHTTTYPAFIGTESLPASIGRTAILRGLTIEVTVCPSIAPGRAADRRELAALTERAVRSALGRSAAVEAVAVIPAEPAERASA